jgi:hypothetical protein
MHIANQASTKTAATATFAAPSQTADVITPDFGFIDTPRASRPTSRQRRTQHPDRRLIEHCIEFTANHAAADGAFEADPSGNSEFASAPDDIFRSRAAKAMESATKIKAQTLDGLRSKAGVARGVLKDLSAFAAERSQVDFMKSFTEDVIRMQRAALEQQGTTHLKFSAPQD